MIPTIIVHDALFERRICVCQVLMDGCSDLPFAKFDSLQCLIGKYKRFMLAFISCAKTMAIRSSLRVSEMTTPRFADEALHHALNLAQYSASELEDMLRVNAKIAVENRLRYQNFCSEDNRPMPAIGAYTGAVFKRIAPKDFTSDDFLFAQEHLRITSFLYGLLRPLDGIRPYRLEGDVRLSENGGVTMFDYWKPLLTDVFIADIKRQGGLLLNLASAEMKDLFDWKRVEQEVEVITPEFRVWKGEKLSIVVIYAKMCRGEMTRFFIKNRITHPMQLKSFTWEGFTFDEERSTDRHWWFIA